MPPGKNKNKYGLPQELQAEANQIQERASRVVAVQAKLSQQDLEKGRLPQGYIEQILQYFNSSQMLRADIQLILDTLSTIDEQKASTGYDHMSSYFRKEVAPLIDALPDTLSKKPTGKSYEVLHNQLQSSVRRLGEHHTSLKVGIDESLSKSRNYLNTPENQRQFDPKVFYTTGGPSLEEVTTNVKNLLVDVGQFSKQTMDNFGRAMAMQAQMVPQGEYAKFCAVLTVETNTLGVETFVGMVAGKAIQETNMNKYEDPELQSVYDIAHDVISVVGICDGLRTMFREPQKYAESIMGILSSVDGITFFGKEMGSEQGSRNYRSDKSTGDAGQSGRKSSSWSQQASTFSMSEREYTNACLDAVRGASEMLSKR